MLLRNGMYFSQSKLSQNKRTNNSKDIRFKWLRAYSYAPLHSSWILNQIRLITVAELNLSCGETSFQRTILVTTREVDAFKLNRLVANHEVFHGVEATNGMAPKTGDNLLPKRENQQNLAEKVRQYATGLTLKFSIVLFASVLFVLNQTGDRQSRKRATKRHQTTPWKASIMVR